MVYLYQRSLLPNHQSEIYVIQFNYELKKNA